MKYKYKNSLISLYHNNKENFNYIVYLFYINYIQITI